MTLLELTDIHVAFGGLVAPNGVSFSVAKGQIKGVIGPNGAGKTTLFNVISGIQPPQAGRSQFQGQSIAGRPPCQIAALGISRTFQNPSLFPNMTALENVMVGRQTRTHMGLLASALRLPAQRREERRILEKAMACLREVGLADAAHHPVGALSFGQRRMIELARALATEPKLLLLDEPASGLNMRETDDLAQMIRRIRDDGVTLLLVEHDMSLVMDVCDEMVVMHFGQIIAEGPPAAIRNNTQVIDIYLGGGFDDASG